MIAALILASASTAHAQQIKGFEIGGYGSFGQIHFTATESFTAIIGDTAGPFFGGGARVGLPWFNLFVDIGAWKFKDDGERVLRLDGETYPLGIPVNIEMTPIELTVGYRFNQLHRFVPRLTPYIGGGYTSVQYKETSSFAASGEDADDRFGGQHLMGGAELKILKWLGIAGEYSWMSVPDAIGKAGISKEFGETDLGGRTLRAKITVGR